MSDIKTTEDLYDRISSEYSWRQKELTAVKFSIDSASGISFHTEIRKGVLLLYAHWEGFIKNSACFYLEFVANQRLKCSELNPHFLSLIFRKKLNACESSRKIIVYKNAVDEIILLKDDIAKIPYKRQIDTESNLKYHVFEDIMLTMGLSIDKYSTKCKFINDILLKNRNSIAHGERTYMDQKDFLELYDEIIGLIRSVKDDIVNAATLKIYKRI